MKRIKSIVTALGVFALIGNIHCGSASRFNDITGDDGDVSRQSRYLSEITPSESELEEADSCSVLDERLRNLAKAQLVDFWENTGGGMTVGSGFSDESSVEASVESTGTGSSASSTQSSGSEYTGQNSQVAGSIEPDDVFSNGEIVAVYDAGSIKIYQAWPVADVKLLYTLKGTDIEEGVVFERMILEGDSLIVMAHTSTVLHSTFGLDSYSDGRAEIFRYTVSLDQEPQLIERITVTGASWDDARLRNDRLMSLFQVHVLPAFSFYPTAEDGYTYSYSVDSQASLDEHMAKQFELIDAWNIADHLPVISVTGVDGNVSQRQVNCGDILQNELSTGENLRLATVSSVEGEAQGLSSLVGVLTPEESEVFMTEDALLLATGVNRYLYEILNDQDAETTTSTLHYFSIDDEGLIYRDSALLAGTVKDQWFMNIHDGLVQVFAEVYTHEATDDLAFTFNTPKDVVLSLFNISDNQLVKTGELSNIVANEEIFSVRYVENLTYVVTYEIVRNYDPLFVIDVSDETAPIVLGSLDMPGFSSYLELIDDGLMLGVGHSDADCVWDYCMTSDIKIDLYDVIDSSVPTKVAEEITETEWSSVIGHLDVHFEAETQELFLPYTKPYIAYSNGFDQMVDVYQVSGQSLQKSQSIDVDDDAVGSVLKTLIFTDTATQDRTLYVVGSDGIQTIAQP